MASPLWSSVFLLGFLSFVLGTSSQRICPTNWIQLQGSCYMISSSRVNWDAARAACETLGSALAVVTSKTEHEALAAKAPGSIWIGLYRDPKDTSRWLWVDGTTPSYTSWSPGEPSGGSEGCTITWFKGLWNDAPCSGQHFYVCEEIDYFSANGVTVACGDKNMTITISKFQFPGLDRDRLQLLDTSCKAVETSAHFSLVTPLTGCNTSSKHSPTDVVYSNKVVGITMLPMHKLNITRGCELEISFSCFYSKSGVASSVSFKPSDRKVIISDEGHGNFTLTLDMFPDDTFTSAYTNDDYPVAVLLRQRLFFEVSVTLGDKQLSVKANRCYATPSEDGNSHLKYEFIKDGCPTDETVNYHSAPAVSAQRFSMEAFNFIANHPFVFVHCHVIICNATDPGSLCAKKCPSSSRRRRDDHLNEKYTLTQGPIFIRKAKEEGKRDTSIERGFSPTLLVALFVMCVVVFAGMALIAYKRSHT